MTWRYSKAKKEIPRPDSEHGLHVDGPLTASDWRMILADVAEEMTEQARREGAYEQSMREANPPPAMKRRFRA
jgi:hypothetical protein